MIRLTEHNDWVIFILLACIVIYMVMLISLQRGATLQEYILQNFSDSSNGFINWVIVSVVFITLVSTLISEYVPIIPKQISDYQLFGYELNKFGFTFFTILIFYIIKIAITYLYYSSIGDGKKWSAFNFVLTKFYFVTSVLLIIICFIHYYFPIDKGKALKIYFISLGILSLFKILYALFNKNQILPSRWYYKILYICTLQILPLLVLWKFLFF